LTEWHWDRFILEYFIIAPPMFHTRLFVCHQHIIILVTGKELD